MKLKKLTIHNIASFQDAVIDFEKEPLNSADVFLITGITGSGKSTILDAICMALYGKTPRIEEADTTSVINKHDGLTLTDARRFLRRNAGEGFVALQFNASDINFEAYWGVNRAYNKPNGTLQKRVWTLTDLDKKHTLKIEADIKERISQLIGLDYDQFCRTTMLSQGEFDKFLSSKESEKAEILEKITGADIYQRIGSRIFAVTKQHKEEYDICKLKLDQIKVLSDEEIESLNKLIAESQTKIDQINSQIKTLSDDRNWLVDEDRLAKTETDLTEQLNTAVAETQTDDFIAAKADIDQYDATGQARNFVRQIAEQQKVIADANKKFDSLKSSYAALLADCAEFDNSIAALKSKLSEANNSLQNELPRKKAYDAAGEICSQLNNALNANKKADEYRKDADDLSNQINSIAKQLEDLQPKLEKQRQDLENSKKQNSELQKCIDDKNVADLRKQKDTIQLSLTNIANAVSAVNQYKNNCSFLADVQASLDKYADDKAKQEADLKVAEAVFAAKADALKSARTTRDKQSVAAGDAAQTLRNGLIPGDKCPVCGQIIIDTLPIADTLKKILDAADQALADAERDYLKAQENVHACRSRIKTDDDNINDAKAKQNKYKAETEESLNNLKQACNICNVSYSSPDETLAALQNSKSSLELALNDLNKSIAEVDNLQIKLNKLQAQFEKDRKKCDDDANLINSISNKQTELSSARSTKIELAASQKTIADAAKENVATLLADSPDWDNDPLTLSQKFCAELTEKKENYIRLTELVDTLDKDINNKTLQADAAKKAAARVADSMPQWADIVASKPSHSNDVAEALNAVAADVKSAADAIAAANVTIATAQHNLDSFIQDNPDFSAQRISELANISDQQIQSLRQTISKLNEKVNNYKGALEQAITSHAQHSLKRPKALCENPDTTKEQLSQNIENLENDREQITQQRGAITQKINANDEAIARRRSDQEECDKLAAVYQRWEALNKLIGDSEGKRFRTIALSYVLNSLIRSANVYMSRLTDRYTLSVQPGTFIILVTDAYQGYTTRTANTISGGETFLVSLALALALSDLGSLTGIDTLFIDEGFGTLSGEPLQKAIETLRLLHSNNRRRVGIISHVAELRERIPVQIQVTQSDRTAPSTLKIVP